MHAAGDDSRHAPIIPLLFDPLILAMHGKRMLFSGLQRQGNQEDPTAPMFMQEWSVEVMQEALPELVETPHRPPS